MTKKKTRILGVTPDGRLIIGFYKDSEDRVRPITERIVKINLSRSDKSLLLDLLSTGKIPKHIETWEKNPGKYDLPGIDTKDPELIKKIRKLIEEETKKKTEKVKKVKIEKTKKQAKTKKKIGRMGKIDVKVGDIKVPMFTVPDFKRLIDEYGFYFLVPQITDEAYRRGFVFLEVAVEWLDTLVKEVRKKKLPVVVVDTSFFSLRDYGEEGVGERLRVYGNTYPVREILKSLGFRWDPDIYGWERIVKIKKDSLKEVLSVLSELEKRLRAHGYRVFVSDFRAHIGQVRIYDSVRSFKNFAKFFAFVSHAIYNYGIGPLGATKEEIEKIKRVFEELKEKLGYPYMYKEARAKKFYEYSIKKGFAGERIYKLLTLFYKKAEKRGKGEEVLVEEAAKKIANILKKRFIRNYENI